MLHSLRQGEAFPHHHPLTIRQEQRNPRAAPGSRCSASGEWQGKPKTVLLFPLNRGGTRAARGTSEQSATRKPTSGYC